MNRNKLSVANIILCGIFTALVAIGAFIKIPTPTVPITLQLFFTTLAGLLLGGKIGAISVSAYVLLGLVGVPIFANGGGFGYVMQPTFGYLLGFIVGAYVTGKIANKNVNITYGRLIAASVTGLILVYSLGFIYFWLVNKFYIGTEMGTRTLFLYCCLLPLPGDLAMCGLACVLGKRLLPVFKKEFAKT